MNNMATGTAAENVDVKLFAAGLSTAGISAGLKNNFASELADYPHTFSHPQNFTNNIFWDNRASNGNRVGSDTEGYALEGLGLGASSGTKWKYDMGSSDGGQLQPMNSIIQTLDCFYFPEFCDGSQTKTEPYSCPSLLPMNFPSQPPFIFDCNAGLSRPNASPVNGEFKWGNGLSIQVRGLAATLAGSNTFIVVSELAPGPIGDYSRVAIMRRELIVEDASVSAPEKSQKDALLRETKQTREVEERNEALPMEEAVNGARLSVVCAWLSLAATIASLFLVLLGKSAKATRANLEESEDELDSEQQGEQDKKTPINQMNRQGGLRHLVLSLLLALGFTMEAVADECTLDCTEFGTPIPQQIKYKTPLFIPPVINKSNLSTCGEHFDMYIKEGYQSMGIKSDDGTELFTPIYGYVRH
jgi:hypothetical protein